MVHTQDDLDAIAAVARAHDVTVITDEVYESVTWGGRHNQCIAKLPEMRERTFTVMGLTKTFSIGGWRVGIIAFRRGRSSPVRCASGRRDGVVFFGFFPGVAEFPRSLGFAERGGLPSREPRVSEDTFGFLGVPLPPV